MPSLLEVQIVEQMSIEVDAGGCLGGSIVRLGQETGIDGRRSEMALHAQRE
jgi:hypothetical protein